MPDTHFETIEVISGESDGKVFAYAPAFGYLGDGASLGQALDCLFHSIKSVIDEDFSLRPYSIDKEIAWVGLKNSSVFEITVDLAKYKDSCPTCDSKRLSSAYEARVNAVFKASTQMEHSESCLEPHKCLPGACTFWYDEVSWWATKDPEAFDKTYGDLRDELEEKRMSGQPMTKVEEVALFALNIKLWFLMPPEGQYD